MLTPSSKPDQHPKSNVLVQVVDAWSAPLYSLVALADPGGL